ncbi:peptidoglycan-binding protein [Amycolatopsis nigrescens]|uniref:peptidoglycan-binding protein n=1 Tax=Amycolatopsis nigrescens TaxID=381445 RepID=UPI001B7F8F2A|nr:peptidoglycan-binding protein [Amycolatopsis nigrescens]
MLGDLELEQVQFVETDEDQVFTRHPVPGLEGDFLQDLGRRGARLRLAGVLTRPETPESLAALRTKFHAGEPVAFVSDISSATLVDRVLIEEMDVRELAGRPSMFEYAFALREFTEAEPIDTDEVDIPPPPPPEVESGKLAVTVVVEGEPDFDMSRVRVTVRGTEASSGAALERVLTNRTRDNVWFEDPFPAGEYTAEALVDDSLNPGGVHEVLTGSAAVTVQDGQTASVTIVLRRGAKTATFFVIHFRFDKAFVEPCMRHVLQQVAEFAEAHRDQRLLIVGHTDLVGDDPYNQALSERRGRATYAMLTFGHDPQASVNEWNELRRARPAGQTTTVRDTWGTREYQHMLADLGYFQGNVGGDPVLTDDAVRRFQRDNGLADDGVVGDGTWPVLIEAYLGHEPIDIPAAQLMPNANATGCDHGPLRWLGCGEQDPVVNVQDAKRQNRRTELMFVRESAMPCQVPKPATLDLVPDGAGGGGWCLDDGTARAVDCFVVPHGETAPTGQVDPNRPWFRVPAEPGTFVVEGRITFEDGTPYVGRYVLIAPDGEFMDREVPKSRPPAVAGTPLPGRTRPDGGFSYEKQKGPGTFTIEVEGPFVARARSQSLDEVRSNAVCFRLDGGAPADIVLVHRSVAGIRPSVTAPDVVVVRKPHTSPARRPVVLQATGTAPFTGTFTRSSDRVRFFDAPAGGTEITFNGTDNVFTDAQLLAGQTLFAEGFSASAAVGDVTLRLAITVGAVPGFAATRTMTSVELTLDVGLSRPAAGVEPPVLAVADKAPPGRPLQLQDALRSAERAMLIVRQPQPAGFTGDLVLNLLNGRVRLFTTETPAAGDVPLTASFRITGGTVPANGLRLFAEGAAVSAAAGDAGIQLGLDGVEPDGDRVAATVIQVEVTANAPVASPPLTAVRIGLWDNAFDPVSGILRNAPGAPAFVDLDTRKFHFRVTDARQAGTAFIAWRTEFDDGTLDDVRPTLPGSPPVDTEDITVTETAPGTKVFVSAAVMLVADAADQTERVESGLAAGDVGKRGVGDRNHRLRRITVDDTHPLTSRSVCRYSVLNGVNPFTVRLPVFQRSPEDRRRVRVHLVDVRKQVGGVGFLPPREALVKGTIRAAYAACGIFAEIDVVTIDPPAATTVWKTLFPGDPLGANPSVEVSGTSGSKRVASASEASVVSVARPLFPSGQDDIFLVMVSRIVKLPDPGKPHILTEFAGGEAHTDAIFAAGGANLGFGFLGAESTITAFADPHEMTHLTTNLSNAAAGHFDLGAVGAAAPGPIDGRNLMNRFPLLAGAGTSNPKRLWDQNFTNTARVPNFVIPAQVTAIRGSRFVKPY